MELLANEDGLPQTKMFFDQLYVILHIFVLSLFISPIRYDFVDLRKQRTLHWLVKTVYRMKIG